MPYDKVSVQGVVVLGGYFAALCQELEFNETFFFHYQLSKGTVGITLRSLLSVLFY